MAKPTRPGDWDQLRSDLQALPGDGPFSVKVEPGADPEVAQQVSNLFEITLPDGEYLVGTDNARVVVAVNFRGQCFLENRLVQDAELKVELRLRLQNGRPRVAKIDAHPVDGQSDRKPSPGPSLRAGGPGGHPGSPAAGAPGAF